MATYTATELRDLSDVPGVNVWSEANILLKQSIAESILANNGITSDIIGYAEGVIVLFNWIADNSSSRSSQTQGKVSKAFNSSELPIAIKRMFPIFFNGTSIPGIQGAMLVRSDIGLR